MPNWETSATPIVLHSQYLLEPTDSEITINKNQTVLYCRTNAFCCKVLQESAVLSTSLHFLHMALIYSERWLVEALILHSYLYCNKTKMEGKARSWNKTQNLSWRESKDSWSWTHLKDEGQLWSRKKSTKAILTLKWINGINKSTRYCCCEQNKQIQDRQILICSWLKLSF